MEKSTDFGYKEQEILIKALVQFITNKYNLNEGITIGTVRISIAESEKKFGKTLKEMKLCKEAERDAFFLSAMEIYFDRMKIDFRKKSAIKESCVKIYNRWKEINRPSDPPSPMTNVNTYDKISLNI